MIIKNLIDNLRQFHFHLKENIKKIYQNSSFYDNKISKTKNITLSYKPSPLLIILNCKISKKKI